MSWWQRSYRAINMLRSASALVKITCTSTAAWLSACQYTAMTYQRKSQLSSTSQKKSKPCQDTAKVPGGMCGLFGLPHPINVSRLAWVCKHVNQNFRVIGINTNIYFTGSSSLFPNGLFIFTSKADIFFYFPNMLQHFNAISMNIIFIQGHPVMKNWISLWRLWAIHTTWSHN